MTKAYKPPENLSIETVSPILWRFILTLLAFLIIGGLLLVILLSLGIADPPRAGSLKWEAKNADDWPLAKKSGDFHFYRATTDFPILPFTLELTADNTGDLDSAWGVWIGSWSILINREGYFSISTDEKPHWAEFIHIRQDGDNKLYLDIQKNGAATLRINDEIAWTGNMPISENANWGVVLFRHPILTWESVEMYAL